MGNFFSFIKSKTFFIHLAISASSVLLVVFVLINYLSTYTNHGEYVEVPDFTEKRVSELTGFVKDKFVNYSIIDSVYDPQLASGIVIKQDPLPNSKVKHNRNIYLYVTSMVAPQIEMPKLTDRSERQAKFIIESYGLKLGKVTTQSADCNGCVIAQLHKGNAIEAGTGIKKGTVIDIVVGVKETYYTASADTTTNANTNAADSFDNEK